MENSGEWGKSDAPFRGALDRPTGFLPSSMTLEDSVVKVRAGSETSCSEELDGVVLGHLTSSPLDPFPHKDFRGKFKKMRQRKRPTILESRYHTFCLCF